MFFNDDERKDFTKAMKSYYVKSLEMDDKEEQAALKAEFDLICGCLGKDGSDWEWFTAQVVDNERAGRLSVEVLGSWAWITTKTYELKEDMKRLGARWSHTKRAWYWRAEGFKRKRRGKYGDLANLAEHWGVTIAREVEIPF